MEKQNHSSVSVKRQPYLDALRGFAMILVVAPHVLSANRELFNEYTALSTWIYSFHMPLFFFLSGYCQYLSSGHLCGNTAALSARAKKTVFKLLNCYFLWSGIYYLFRFGDQLPFTNEWFCAVFTFRGRAPLWFLAALAFAQLMLYLVQGLTKGRFRWIAVFVAVSALLTVFFNSWMLVHYPKELQPAADSPFKELFTFYLTVTLCRTLPCFFFVGIGYLTAPIHRRLSNVKSPILFAAGGIFTLIAYLVERFTGNSSINLHLFKMGNPWIFFFTGLVTSVGLLLLFQVMGKRYSFPILRLLGLNSIGIMTLHYTPFFTMSLAFQLASSIPHLSVGALYALTITFTIAFSLAASLLIKKKLYL